MRCSYYFTTKLALNSFVQYNSYLKKYMVNCRLRYNPREGNDLYIVYNEGLNTDLNRETPTLPRSEVRSVLIKYTYTFGL